MRSVPRSQEIYRHFKGNLYQVITLAEHSETGERLIIYQAMYGEFTVYARPLSLFMDKTDKVKYPEARQEYRFELQEKPADHQTEQKHEDHHPAIYKKKPEAQEDQEEAEKEAEAEAEGCDWEIDGVDPMVMKFLTADSYEQRLQILSGSRHRITHDMINTMAAAMELEIADGELGARYDELRRCLLTIRRFETRRR